MNPAPRRRPQEWREKANDIEQNLLALRNGMDLQIKLSTSDNEIAGQVDIASGVRTHRG